MENQDKLRYVKVILSACLMVGASVGLCFYASGVFFQPLAQGLSISVGQSSMLTMFMLIFMALTTLLVPGLLRRFKFHYILLAGTALAAGSAVLLGFCFNRFWIYLFASLMGCGAALIGPVPATTWINNWFEQRKSWTTAIVLAGSALSAAALSPLMSLVITNLGWRMGFVTQAILIVVLCAPALLLKMPLTAAAAGSRPYGDEANVPASHPVSTKILGLFAIMALLSACLIALPMHFSTLATSIGQASLAGATMLSWCMIGNMVFKLLGGWLSDHLKPVMATGILDAVGIIGTIGILIALNMGSMMGLQIMAFFYGAVFGLGELSLPLFVSTRFGRKHYLGVYALLNFISTLTTALAIPAVGFLYDSMRSYIWIYAIALAIEVVILGVIWLLIHDESAQDLVNSKAAAPVLSKIREFSAKRQEAKADKEAQAQAEAQQAALAQPVEESAAKETEPAAGQDGEPVKAEEPAAAEEADQESASDTAAPLVVSDVPEDLKEDAPEAAEKPKEASVEEAKPALADHAAKLEAAPDQKAEPEKPEEKKPTVAITVSDGDENEDAGIGFNTKS